MTEHTVSNEMIKFNNSFNILLLHTTVPDVTQCLVSCCEPSFTEMNPASSLHLHVEDKIIIIIIDMHMDTYFKHLISSCF